MSDYERIAEIGRLKVALAAKDAEIEKMTEILEWIDVHFDNQDMDHVDFRVEAATLARDALDGKP